MASADQQVFLLDLPLELRNQIYGELFFPCGKEPAELIQDALGLARTAVRQIFPYDVSLRKKPRFDTAIIRTCKQIQDEAEEVLYGTSSFNLMYPDWSNNVKVSYKFLESLVPRNRKRIRRIERKCYSKSDRDTISLTDWKLFMTFLSRECPNLISLKLWGPGDRHEAPQWIESCQREKEWVQAILQIKTLKHFDVPVIKGGIIYQYPEFTGDFLPWLKTTLLQPAKDHPAAQLTQTDNVNRSPHQPFPLMRLPVAIRQRIYGHALLPPSKHVHPYIRPWYDQTTRNLIPLLRTCRQVREEVEEAFYSTAVFTSLKPIKYDTGLLHFFRGTQNALRTVKQHDGLPLRLRGLIRHVRVENAWSIRFYLLHFLAQGIESLQTLTLVLDNDSVDDLNALFEGGMPRPWDPQDRLSRISPGRRRYSKLWSRRFLRQLARIPGVRIMIAEGRALHPDVRPYLETGLRSIYLSKEIDVLEAWIIDDQPLGGKEAE
ncbi:hypothetical protein W97_06584 [Coniosporium apollinis CBS 100218]|uniref:F-box domain-containing protein n=1 Tax=Coniosporium apollinis (strain CBS 100218) TaxID=1168221 RepID=R7Z076_CONA1|nr:uncharacterized protein W97_06584 [Coniosporium apollinis CBS 100218]EON67331.1 hypothetical protein W97_06584 [Coniosporium apollinis CBS 100218]